MSLRVKNWSKFQHYKDRCPPWIKLHREVMNDMAFMALTLEQRAVLMFVWVLAAEGDGEVPDDPKVIAWRLRVPTVDLESLVSAGFLERTLADASRCSPETERETEESRDREEAEQNASEVSQSVVSEQAVGPRESPEKPPEWSADEKVEYTQAVWQAVCERRRSETPEMSSAEFDVIRRWMDQRVPLSVVLRAVKDSSKPPPNVRYLAPVVKEAYSKWRHAMTGAAQPWA